MILACIGESCTNFEKYINTIEFEALMKVEEEFDIYDLDSPGKEAAILTAMSYNIPLSEIDDTFYLKEYAEIKILGEKAMLYQIFLKDESVGFITNDFSGAYEFYYNPSKELELVLYYSTSDSKRRYIRYDIQEEYSVIEYLYDE